MRSLAKKIVCIIGICILATFSCSTLAKHKHKKVVKTPPTPIYGTQNLATTINNAIQNIDPNLNIGVGIKSMKNGEILYSRNKERSYIPASILKILTAEAALLYLGSDYTFQTNFYTDATTVKDGILSGNLYLVHSGDPTLTYYDLLELIDALKAKQIQQIDGNIYIDTTAYDQAVYGPGWLWSDTRYCYGAPISASIINHNCFSLTGKSARTPVSGQGITRVVADIIEYNKSLLRTLFRRSGVQVNGTVISGAAPPNLTVVVSHDSKPLHQLIMDMLKKSDNIIAGSLFKKIGEMYSKQPGSWENGSKAVSHILAQKAGVNTEHLSVLDGSGLSRYNQITPAQMLQVLAFAYHNLLTNFDFISGLPVAGIDGTLKHRLSNIAWKVRAKTGTMSGVYALAGYAMTRDKEPLAFVIIVNSRMGMGWKYKELEDRIVTAMTKFSRREKDTESTPKIFP